MRKVLLSAGAVLLLLAIGYALSPFLFSSAVSDRDTWRGQRTVR